MESADRYNQYKETKELDRIIILIKRGTIKCGKYANRIKIDKTKMSRKELFTNDQRRKDPGESGQQSKDSGYHSSTGRSEEEKEGWIPDDRSDHRFWTPILHWVS